MQMNTDPLYSADRPTTLTPRGMAEQQREMDASPAPYHENTSNPNGLPADSIDPRLLALAMGFVPRQAWDTPYELDVAFKRGTLFPGLDQPFLGERPVNEEVTRR